MEKKNQMPDESQVKNSDQKKKEQQDAGQDQKRGTGSQMEHKEGMQDTTQKGKQGSQDVNESTRGKYEHGHSDASEGPSKSQNSPGSPSAKTGQQDWNQDNQKRNMNQQENAQNNTNKSSNLQNPANKERK